jgi:hypothetical protein
VTIICAVMGLGVRNFVRRLLSATCRRAHPVEPDDRDAAANARGLRSDDPAQRLVTSSRVSAGQRGASSVLRTTA